MNKISHIIACAAILFSAAYTPAFAEPVDGAAAAPASQPPPAPSAMRGKALFDSFCIHCHKLTSEASITGAPGLKDVLKRYDENWLNNWLKSPENFAKTNETAKKLILSNKFGLAEPTIPAMQDDAARADVIEYLKIL